MESQRPADRKSVMGVSLSAMDPASTLTGDLKRHPAIGVEAQAEG
jgi:hypothetical protein